MNFHLSCFQVESILNRLGLNATSNYYSGNLSGGEQKRLSIALELVDDPSILFLDEPTTGLDSSSSTQCIQLLKSLAQEGKTIICSIHTPSALLFEMFDHLYALADGCCIYQGSTENLVPFLNDLDLVCPETYNPSDFLLEIANNDYGNLNHRLIEKLNNGVNSYHASSDHEHFCCEKLTQDSFEMIQSTSSSQLICQLKQLLIRNFIITTRNKCLSAMRLGIHLVTALFIGTMYIGIGDDAWNIFNIYKLLFFNIFLLMFTAFSSLQTSCKKFKVHKYLQFDFHILILQQSRSTCR